MDEDKFYDMEMERLEREQKGLRDQYNQERLDYNEYEYHQLIRGSSIEYAPKEGQTLVSWLPELHLYIKLLEKVSIKSHIKGPKGAWWTHDKNPAGCFMCDDLIMVNTLKTILTKISITNPEIQI